MPTFTYDERVVVVKAMESAGTASCPRCGSAIETHRLQSTQDKLFKRPGKPLYRCSNRQCACECTPMTHMTVAPSGPSASRPAPQSSPLTPPRSVPPVPPPGGPSNPPAGTSGTGGAGR